MEMDWICLLQKKRQFFVNNWKINKCNLLSLNMNCDFYLKYVRYNYFVVLFGIYRFS